MDNFVKSTIKISKNTMRNLKLHCLDRELSMYVVVDMAIKKYLETYEEVLEKSKRKKIVRATAFVRRVSDRQDEI